MGRLLRRRPYWLRPRRSSENRAGHRPAWRPAEPDTRWQLSDTNAKRDSESAFCFGALPLHARAAIDGSSPESIEFASSIATILSNGLQAASLHKSVDNADLELYCSIVLDIIEYVNRLLESELAPLLAGETPASIDSDNIVAAAIRASSSQGKLLNMYVNMIMLARGFGLTTIRRCGN